MAGDLEDVFPLLHQLDYPVKMDSLALNLMDTTVDDISEIIGPYLRDYLRHRGRSRNGLGLYLSSRGTVKFRVEDAGETDFFPLGRHGWPN